MYDLLVIGAGPAGYVAAIRASQRKLKVGLIERAHAGGTCLNRGCIPTKSLLHSSETFRGLKGLDALGIQADNLAYDFRQIHANKEKLVSTQREGLEQLIMANKVELLRGDARIISEGRIAVSTENEKSVYEAKNILIATGSHPAMPPIPGLDLPGVVTSDQLLEGEIPEASSLIIIGGGVIGIEFASFYAGLGKDVTVLELMPTILPLLDKDISRLIGQHLKQMGVKVVPAAMVLEVNEGDGVAGGSDLIVRAEVKGKIREYGSEQVLVATGRRATIDGLWNEDCEPELERGFIKVDENFRTSLPGVYAVGDVIGGNLLAHEAEAEGRAVVQCLLGEAIVEDMRFIPSVIYTVPEAASVGMSEAQADASAIDAATHKILMAANARTQIDALGRGFIKLVYEKETHKLLGVHMVCGRAGDMIAEYSTLLSHGMTVADLLRGIRPHPSFAEGMTEALEGILGESIHTLN